MNEKVDGVAPLYVVLNSNNNIEVVKVLVENGASLEDVICDTTGENALYVLVLEVVVFLFKGENEIFGVNFLK